MPLFDSIIPTSGYLPKRSEKSENKCLYKDLYINDHTNSVHNVLYWEQLNIHQ